jgi:O-antigen/teichoic acid export membrane protein
MMLGIYYNLTVWYKLTDKTRFGAYIMVIGAIITIVFNWLLIPVWGYAACAWGTLLCYGSMMVLSYYWGQKHYPIPYNTPKLLRYLGLMLMVYFIHYMVTQYVTNTGMRVLSGTALFMIYLGIIVRSEKEELKTFPVIGKLLR